nr:unnamed protein product [Meloidogyne enterolobii]
MVQEAEKYRGEDCFNIKQTMEDDKLKDKISEGDKKVLDKCQEMLS